ncbi:hypothetical protein U1Q18_039835 [Sarracenia purpurea var. burkii]
MHILSPLVPPRQFYFLRYCAEVEAGAWVMVDVSYDRHCTTDDDPHASTTLRSWRLPSGCMLQDRPNGCCEVTWVEHVEVDDKSQTHRLYRDLVCAGAAHGNLSLAVLWYGRFHSGEKKVIRAFIESLTTDRSLSFQPDVYAWWQKVESYATVANKGGSFGKKKKIPTGGFVRIAREVYDENASAIFNEIWKKNTDLEIQKIQIFVIFNEIKIQRDLRNGGGDRGGGRRRRRRRREAAGRS